MAHEVVLANVLEPANHTRRFCLVKPSGDRVPAGSYEAQFLAEVVMLFAAVARHNPLSGLKQ